MILDGLGFSPSVSTTPLLQWGFRQCLPFSWAMLREKHCRHSIAAMGVVDPFGISLLTYLHISKDLKKLDAPFLGNIYITQLLDDPKAD